MVKHSNLAVGMCCFNLNACVCSTGSSTLELLYQVKNVTSLVMISTGTNFAISGSSNDSCRQSRGRGWSGSAAAGVTSPTQPAAKVTPDPWGLTDWEDTASNAGDRASVQARVPRQVNVRRARID